MFLVAKMTRVCDKLLVFHALRVMYSNHRANDGAKDRAIYKNEHGIQTHLSFFAPAA